MKSALLFSGQFCLKGFFGKVIAHTILKFVIIKLKIFVNSMLDFNSIQSVVMKIHQKKNYY